MKTRRLGRTGFEVSEIGYGAWGIGKGLWVGAEDEESLRALHSACDLGLNFVDTALAYGPHHSERLVGRLLRERKERLYVATKVPPKNRAWPARPEVPLEAVFPADHIRDYTERSLANLGVPAIDLLQFHVWRDEWAEDARWQRVVSDLRSEGLVRAVGISINRWEPWNALRTLRTGLIDAVQVIYNIFDQAPEDELFPTCRELDIGVIARVPFDEGTLTGSLTPESRWPEGDFRSLYFRGEKLAESITHAAGVAAALPTGITLPEAALRFILSNPDVSVTIPGMRKPQHVRGNIAASAAGPLSDSLRETLRAHRWDRKPTASSG